MNRNYLKLIDQIRKLYSGCVVTKTNQNVNLQSIIPLYLLTHNGAHLMYSKYLYMPLSSNLMTEYQNYRITVIPEPSTIFYETINNRIIKGGIFKMIDTNNNSTNIVLLYNTRVFLKYHYLKFLEYNRMNTNMSGDVYLNTVIYNISKIDNENIFDFAGDNIML